MVLNVCPKCGGKALPHSLHCPHCGALLSTSASRQKSGTFNLIIGSAVLLILLALAVVVLGPKVKRVVMVLSATAIPQRSMLLNYTPLCSYARLAASQIEDVNSIMEGSMAKNMDSTALRRGRDKISAQMTSFARADVPSEGTDMQMLISNYLLKTVELYDAWLAGQDGQSQAAASMQALDLAAREIQRVREAYNCW